MWPGDVETLTRGWHEDVEQLAAESPALDGKEHFAVLQHVASVLRTSLTYDVESRLR